MRVRWPVRVSLAGVAIANLLWRTVSGAPGIADSFLLPFVLLSADYILEAADIGWILGWLLFAGILVHLAPRLYPDNVSHVVSWVPVRLAVAGSALSIGVIIEHVVVVEWFGIGTTPFEYGLTSILPALGASAAVFTVVVSLKYLLDWKTADSSTATGYTSATDRTLSANSATRGVRSTRGTSSNRWNASGGSSSATSRSIVAASVSTGPVSMILGSVVLSTFLGLLFAAVSLLYPLPELIVIGWFLRDLVLVRFLGIDDSLITSDIAERFAVGSIAIWSGTQGLFVSTFVCAGLFLSIIYPYYVRIHVDNVFEAGILPGVFTLAVLGTATIHAVWYWLRIVDRLPTSLFRDDSAAPIGRVPGLLIPSGLLVGLFSTWTYATPSGQDLPGTVPLGYVLVAGILIAIAFGAIRVPEFAVENPGSDYLVIPIAFVMFAALPPSIGNEVVGEAVYLALTRGELSLGPMLYAAGIFGGVAAVCLLVFFSPTIVSAAIENEFSGITGLLATYSITVVGSFVFAAVHLLVGDMTLPSPIRAVIDFSVPLLFFAAVVHTIGYVLSKIAEIF